MKYFIWGAAYGIALGIIMPLLKLDNLPWPQGLIVAILMGLATGGCFLAINRIFFSKKKAAS